MNGRQTPHGILSIACPDRRGIVSAVSTFLFEQGCTILESQQFGDPSNGRFFLRISFASEEARTLAELKASFAPISDRFAMTTSLNDARLPTRTVIMVSKLGHCLVDLLYRVRIGALPITVPLVVSNHREFADVAASHGIPFRYLPITPDNKADQEAALAELLEAKEIELVVLARYMQILSPEFCARWEGRVINIHHSFLPSFKGARPYAQAHDRGVKLIGATAHYVTSHLDEGPIIEQEVERVTHAMSPAEFAAVGRDIESRVLARAVKWHAEHRILLNEGRTVVFS